MDGYSLRITPWMTVEELKTELEKLPPKAKVQLYGYLTNGGVHVAKGAPSVLIPLKMPVDVNGGKI